MGRSDGADGGRGAGVIGALLAGCSPWLSEHVGCEMEWTLTTHRVLMGMLLRVEPGGVVIEGGSGESWLPLAAIVEVRRPVYAQEVERPVYGEQEGADRRM